MGLEFGGAGDNGARSPAGVVGIVISKGATAGARGGGAEDGNGFVAPAVDRWSVHVSGVGVANIPRKARGCKQQPRRARYGWENGEGSARQKGDADLGLNMG